MSLQLVVESTEVDESQTRPTDSKMKETYQSWPYLNQLEYQLFW